VLGAIGIYALRLYVLKELQEVGFQDIQIEVVRGTDGQVTVKVDAALDINIAGHTQEELAAAGLSEDTLGAEAYGDLLEQLAATD